MSELVKNILMWLFIAVTMFTVFNNFSSESQSEVISYSEFIAQVESDQVLSVEFQNDNYIVVSFRKICKLFRDILYYSPLPEI